MGAGLLCVGACATGLRMPAAPPRQTHLDLDITGLELANGLRVEIVRDPRATDIHVTMRYRVGSADDPVGQAGIAHVVEHLMFQQIVGAQTVFSQLEGITTFFNGETTYDATTYVARAAPSHLDELLLIEAVRLGLRCTSITDSAFEREREVVVNEVAQRDEATEIVGAMHAGLYPSGHPYRAPIGGTEASVRAITRDQACAFAERYYAPSNAVLVVSGNVTIPRVSTALRKYLAHVAARTVEPPAALPAVGDRAHEIEIEAPIGNDAVLLAWPLPPDPLARAELRALATTVGGAVDNEIQGRVVAVSLGDVRQPMIGVVLVPAANETVAEVIHGAETGIGKLPDTLSSLGGGRIGKMAFDRLQQTAIYALFASLEGGNRDTRLAAYVLDGRDPSTGLAREFQGLREMTAEQAATVAREHFAFAQATVVTLKAKAKRRGHHLELEAAIHDLGRRRDPPDPAAAHTPLPATSHAIDASTRKLPNGLSVVLLPSTSVPTVDVRLVFAAGTADEPPDKRGVALVAGRLTWDLHYLNDLLAFAAAGGTDLVEVTADDTRFEARGLDMHLDYLLAGLRRKVREGVYNADSVGAAMRQAAKEADDDDGLTDPWRTALYGAGHPYVAAGLARLANDRLSKADAQRFRADHLTPDNATLVIAGHFDPAVANAWIDFLFADWSGVAKPRQAPRTVPRPASIAMTDDTEQLTLDIALPATAGTRASQLVAAAMLADLAGDVRHQLGATYGLFGALVESRLGAHYEIGGGIDATRAREVVELLRARIEALHTDPTAAAQAFVTAREHVRIQLDAPRGSAVALAANVEHDVALRRAPLSDLDTVNQVEALTIDAMAPTLAELDLPHAAIALRGPRDAIEQGFGALGRTPTYVKKVPQGDLVDPPRASEPDDEFVGELADALTEHKSFDRPPSLALGVTASYMAASVVDHDADGFAFAGEIGHNFDQHAAIGLHLGIGKLGGTFIDGALAPPVPFTLVPIDVKAYAVGTAYERFWGEAMLGLHLDRLAEATTSWHAGIGVDLDVGVDLVEVGGFRLGTFVGGRMVVGGDDSTALVAGLAYRK